MKKISTRLIPMLAVVFALQSCVKDHPFVDYLLKDDKLLLSKVSGHIQSEASWAINGYAYDQNFDFLTTYSYGSKQKGYGYYRPLNKVGYINGGSWDYIYSNGKPDKVTDNSFPGLDLGYWKYDVNSKAQIERTGLAFKIAEQPREYEFYEYDGHHNLKSIIYGKYIDTAFFKVVYTYDSDDNLTEFNYYYPISYGEVSARSFSERFKSSMSAQRRSTRENKLQQILKKSDERSLSEINVKNARGKKGAPDENVVYALLLTGKIISDQMNNPYNQQGSLLFYQTSRFYILRLNDFYLPLLKHNPVKVEYTVDIGDGTLLYATQAFSYTYNKERFPVTINEKMDDPNFFDHGNYIQDFILEYIVNK